MISNQENHNDHIQTPSGRPNGAETVEQGVHHSMICVGCSCLCDDISLYLNEREITGSLNLCEIGWQRLNTLSSTNRRPPLSREALTSTVSRAARILAGHSPTLVLGADSLGGQAILESWKLARALKGIWLPRPFSGMRLFYEQVRQLGWPTALLDEVRDHADTVIFWRADPLITHHRHLSRYSVYARGRYTERGNHDRNLVGINAEKTTMEPLCQQYFQFPAGRDKAFIEALVQPLPENEFDHRDFPLIIKALLRSTYAAIFVDPEKTEYESIKAMFRWANQVNREGRRRMVILPLWNGGANIDGFCRLSLEKNNSAWGVDFSGAFKPSGDISSDVEQVAERARSVLLFESPPHTRPDDPLLSLLADKPRVTIDPFKQTEPLAGNEVIPAALPGIEADDLYFRADGLPLLACGISPLTDCGYPRAENILKDILSEVQPIAKDKPDG